MSDHADPVSLAILTSGGDAPGMNPVVRAVVRTALHVGARPFAIREGWRGAIDNLIEPMVWSDVSSILDKGGTVIGSARSTEFREREGMRTVAANLVRAGIDRLVVIGGDGSLTGADTLRERWTGLLDELVESGEIEADVAARHPELHIAGVVGSIDNDMVGTDMTVGTNSALCRIIDAIDALTSTAASHQRVFVVEVMGRRCGYLALMGAMAGGADDVIIPELPPEDGWEDAMCEKIRAGRAAGRRDSIIVVAEGCMDRHGEKITAQRIQAAIKERTGESPRITALGHVQRGGTPSAYDRWMSTLLGYTAALEVIRAEPGEESCIIGIRNNRLQRLPLVETVANTKKVIDYLEEGDYEAAVRSRGTSFSRIKSLFETLSSPLGEDRYFKDGWRPRVAILHAGGLAPGMNAAARSAVRLGLDRGFEMLGVEGGFPGLIRGDIRPLAWGDVDGWVSLGGAELGTARSVLGIEDYFGLARSIEANGLDAIIMIGGLAGYETAWNMAKEADRYTAFRLPLICVPASIDNNLPGHDLSIGVDTALNTNVETIDKIRRSASASRRCFVVETMGRKCGYLALMSALSTGAEQVYLHETGVDLALLTKEAERMNRAFDGSRSLYLAIRNEDASKYYTADLLRRVFQQEGHGAFSVRSTIIGHQQQGGIPTSYDRTLAVSLAALAIDEVTAQLEKKERVGARYIGQHNGKLESHPIMRIDEEMDMKDRVPLDPWWISALPVLYTVAAREDTTPLEHLAIYDDNR
ncbi:6-phosphofructokinase [Actinotignum schaalii]|uniref:6-phosphofructokinase n=1 Tax=Actinotignum schaalii FB123-CNA-2 TaxID=883067 RepID=S2VHC5_9ACTO|nr:6-phosphofructokinase [Actinotignum schaalii]EPD26131.1 6-phosphofructokinase [Actinotignum schaalii FB123-CNA-2]